MDALINDLQHDRPISSSADVLGRRRRRRRLEEWTTMGEGGLH